MYKESNEQFTIENFVDVTTEVLFQSGYEEVAGDLQELLAKFLRGNINVDEFGFEYIKVLKSNVKPISE